MLSFLVTILPGNGLGYFNTQVCESVNPCVVLLMYSVLDFRRDWLQRTSTIRPQPRKFYCFCYRGPNWRSFSRPNASKACSDLGDVWLRSVPRTQWRALCKMGTNARGSGKPCCRTRCCCIIFHLLFHLFVHLYAATRLVPS